MRRAWSSSAWAATLTLLLVLPACGEERPTRGGGAAPAPPPARGSDDPGPAPGPARAELTLDESWWKRTPAARVFLSGAQRGTLRPTLRTTPPTGGLERTAAVLYRLRSVAREHGTAVAAVSLGWSMRGDLEAQEEARADFVRAVHEQLGYAAALLGGTDILVPAMSQPRGPGAETPTPPLNVKLDDTSPAAGATRLYTDVTVGPVALRTLAIVDPAEAQPLADAGLVDAVSSAAQNMAGLQPKPDAVWLVGARLLGAGARAEIVSSLRRLGPGILVDVGGEGLGADTLDGRPLRADGEPLVVNLPAHGRAVGVLDLDPAEDGAGWVVSYRQIPLVPQWEKYGGSAYAAVRHLRDLYRGLMRDRGYLASFPKVKRHDAQYVGSAACAACHAAIYNDWRTSDHATALVTLEKIEHHWDPACLRCHVVGWDRDEADHWTRWASGFRDPERTPYLGGVGCESCHGPGSAHVARPHDRSLFAPEGPNVRSMGQAACMACHDAENSQGFAAAYADVHLPAVDHRRVPGDRRTVVPADWKPPGGR